MAMKFPEWKEALATAAVILSLLFVAYEIYGAPTTFVGTEKKDGQ